MSFKIKYRLDDDITGVKETWIGEANNDNDAIDLVVAENKGRDVFIMSIDLVDDIEVQS